MKLVIKVFVCILLSVVLTLVLGQVSYQKVSRAEPTEIVNTKLTMQDVARKPLLDTAKGFPFETSGFGPINAVTNVTVNKYSSSGWVQVGNLLFWVAGIFALFVLVKNKSPFHKMILMASSALLAYWLMLVYNVFQYCDFGYPVRAICSSNLSSMAYYSVPLYVSFLNYGFWVVISVVIILAFVLVNLLSNTLVKKFIIPLVATLSSLVVNTRCHSSWFVGCQIDNGNGYPSWIIGSNFEFMWLGFVVYYIFWFFVCLIIVFIYKKIIREIRNYLPGWFSSVTFNNIFKIY